VGGDESSLHDSTLVGESYFCAVHLSVELPSYTLRMHTAIVLQSSTPPPRSTGVPLSHMDTVSRQIGIVYMNRSAAQLKGIYSTLTHNA
jgi:hypothetical protein